MMMGSKESGEGAREIPRHLPKTTTLNNKFSLVVCRNAEGKFLAVKETRGRGWWLPGGRVEP